MFGRTQTATVWSPCARQCRMCLAYFFCCLSRSPEAKPSCRHELRLVKFNGLGPRSRVERADLGHLRTASQSEGRC